MKNIFKLALFFAIFFNVVFANDNLVIEFEKKRLSQNPNIVLNSVEVFYKKKLDIKGDWSAYVLNLDLDTQDGNMRVKDILFSNNQVVTTELFDLKSGTSFGSNIAPDINESYYDNSRLIAGKSNAKNRLVVFSDPLCPFCQHYIPQLIDFVNKNEESIALYYYAFPLTRIHKASNDLSKLIEIAKQTDKNIIKKAYEIRWEKYFDVNSEDRKLILNSFNKALKTNISLKELEDEKYQKALEDEVLMAEKLLINGTPTIYVNGKKDNTKEEYKKLKGVK